MHGAWREPGEVALLRAARTRYAATASRRVPSSAASPRPTRPARQEERARAQHRLAMSACGPSLPLLPRQRPAAAGADRAARTAVDPGAADGRWRNRGVADLLCEALMTHGHEVALFAAPGSRARAPSASDRAPQHDRLGAARMTPRPRHGPRMNALRIAAQSASSTHRRMRSPPYPVIYGHFDCNDLETQWRPTPTGWRGKRKCSSRRMTRKARGLGFMETAGIEPASAVARKVASTSVAGALILSSTRLAGGVVEDQLQKMSPDWLERTSPGEPAI